MLGEYEKKDGDQRNAKIEFSEIELKLSEIDADVLSPVEALMKIYELKNLLPRDKKSHSLGKLKKAVS